MNIQTVNDQFASVFGESRDATSQVRTTKRAPGRTAEDRLESTAYEALELRLTQAQVEGGAA